ncbi:DUF6912 family protein [Corynebacterium sphenisci]|uniref:DUF6912 family protein n=1 Tax=Corynebacterium sphenisci TaxID=191493 RepID=UPI0026E0465B|nr:hypothetical protein [Corynebacterium sphenisci]MDO5732121.1 hypothetical protein [Corynebacterium sphenisci]
MRVHVPATFGMLAELRDTGELLARRGWAFALTDALRGAYRAGDEEELADVAFTEAARASLRLLSAYSGDFDRRRVVVSADVAASPEPDMGEAVVRLAGPIPADAVAAVHVDLAGAEEAVAAAVAAVDAADLGDEDAELTVGDCLEHELAWYAPQELPLLVELL